MATDEAPIMRMSLGSRTSSPEYTKKLTTINHKFRELVISRQLCAKRCTAGGFNVDKFREEVLARMERANRSFSHPVNGSSLPKRYFIDPDVQAGSPSKSRRKRAVHRETASSSASSSALSEPMNHRRRLEQELLLEQQLHPQKSPPRRPRSEQGFRIKVQSSGYGQQRSPSTRSPSPSPDRDLGYGHLPPTPDRKRPGTAVPSGRNTGPSPKVRPASAPGINTGNVKLKPKVFASHDMLMHGNFRRCATPFTETWTKPHQGTEPLGTHFQAMFESQFWTKPGSALSHVSLGSTSLSDKQPAPWKRKTQARPARLPASNSFWTSAASVDPKFLAEAQSIFDAN